MANGGYWQSKEDWLRAESPLLALDDELTAFAAEHSLRLTKNHKEWPERSLEWGGNIRRLIQVYLADEKTLTFHLWLCASQDRQDGRYWKQALLVEAKPVSNFQESFPELLRVARAELESWSQDVLELAR